MASVVIAAAVTAAPPVLVLERVEVALPNPDTARVTLVAQAASGLPPAGVAGQCLSLGDDVAIPLGPPVQLTADARTTCVTFEVRLRDVPEAVLELDPAAVRVRWEALGADGRPLWAIAGTLDAADRSRLVVAGGEVLEAYARLEDVKLTPGIGALGVRALLSLYNPFAFDLVIVRLEYRLAVGSQTLLAGQRPGVRLRASQRSDVLLEQEVTLAGVAGGVSALLGGSLAQLDGAAVVRTPHGERTLPLHAHSSR